MARTLSATHSLHNGPVDASNGAETHLSVRDLSFAYPGGTPVCSELSFALAEGEIGCLLGPSGCGKTTVLRLIAGLETPSAGDVMLGGRTLVGHGTNIPCEARGIGMVFQDYALFPHLTVTANVAFGLNHLLRGERQSRVNALLAAVGLAGFGAQYPHELSGGQRQRVALARALAPEPALMLLDEPFSNLDTELREKLSHEVRAILKAQGTTALMVTHDQHEAFAMADRIGVMYQGRLEQWDQAYNIYHRPATRFVADFVGQGVFLEGRVRSDGRINTELGLLTPTDSGASHANEDVQVLIRPDDVQHDDASAVQAEVLSKAFRGAEFVYTLKLASGTTVLSYVPSHHNHAIGEKIGIKLEVDHVIAFPQSA